MIYYRFFRGIGDIDRHFIEFWEVCRQPQPSASVSNVSNV